MAAVNFVRSAFNGLLRKPTAYKTPVVCRLSTVALQQKYHAVNIAVQVNNNYSLQNGVMYFSDQYNVIICNISEIHALKNVVLVKRIVRLYIC